MKFKIYKIECLTTGKIYIGQTRTDIKKRINSHIQTFNSGYELYYCHSHDVLLNNNFTIEVIDEVDCNCLCQNGNNYDIWSKYNHCLPNNLEVFYMNYFNSINGTKYNYINFRRKELKEKRLNERKKVGRIKYDYNNIKTNILEIEEVEELKKKYLNDNKLHENQHWASLDITRVIEY